MMKSSRYQGSVLLCMNSRGGIDRGASISQKPPQCFIPLGSGDHLQHSLIERFAKGAVGWNRDCVILFFKCRRQDLDLARIFVVYEIPQNRCVIDNCIELVLLEAVKTFTGCYERFEPDALALQIFGTGRAVNCR